MYRKNVSIEPNTKAPDTALANTTLDLLIVYERQEDTEATAAVHDLTHTLHRSTLIS